MKEMFQAFNSAQSVIFIYKINIHKYLPLSIALNNNQAKSIQK